MEQVPTMVTYRKRIGLIDQLAAVKSAAEEAQKVTDYASAHDQEILTAIEIVEEFLRQTGRVCYGGAAMNAQLPDKYKFYDPEYTIPDYDFLTPTAEKDIAMLERRFRAAGFTEIGIRPGMHEGTTKIYINYVPVADVTLIDGQLYNMFKSHAVKINKITYMDANSLRMMMYLELSRPRGEVERWSKVYERLLLLDFAVPMKRCKGEPRPRQIPLMIYRSVLYYAIQNNRVLAGASVVGAYKAALKGDLKAEWFFGQSEPLIFYSPNLDADEANIRELAGTEVKGTLVEGVGDYVPTVKYLTYLGKPIALLVKESACHSYNTLSLKNGKYILIASLDTLITLYLSLMISGNKKVKGFFPYSVLCMAQQAVNLSNYMRRHPSKSQFPFISVTCSGHQKGLPSLLREKVARIQAAKLKSASFRTQKRSKSRSRKTLKK
jgi:hypothetical protein